MYKSKLGGMERLRRAFVRMIRPPSAHGRHDRRLLGAGFAKVNAIWWVRPVSSRIRGVMVARVFDRANVRHGFLSQVRPGAAAAADRLVRAPVAFERAERANRTIAR